MDYIEFKDEVIDEDTRSSKSLSEFFSSLFGFSYLNEVIYDKIVGRVEEYFIRKIHQLGREAVLKEEENEHDRVIGRMTSSFRREIDDCFSKEKISLPESAKRNIDDFLYLVNANYFDDIQDRDPDTRREFLIEQLLYLIAIHIKEQDKIRFNEVDASEVLETCLFIPDDIKEAIIAEFENSKVGSGFNSHYAIIRNDISGGRIEYLAAKCEDIEYARPGFDIDNPKDFANLINEIANCEYFGALGVKDPKELTWDVSFLQRISKIIATNYRDELLSFDENFSNYDFVYSFITSSTSYAVLNNLSSVDSIAMINTFKDWEYILFDVRVEILSDIFESENIDPRLNPFITIEQERPYQKKIIPFKPVTENQ